MPAVCPLYFPNQRQMLSMTRGLDYIRNDKILDQSKLKGLEDEKINLRN